jgi:small subunit ribosomal protein S21
MLLDDKQLGAWHRERQPGGDATSSLRLETAPTCDSLAYSGDFDGLVQGASRAGEGVFKGVAEVKVQEGESVESALRRFKRKVQQEDIIKDIKKHSFYLKPGDKRRAKQALARKRSRKKLRREME